VAGGFEDVRERRRKAGFGIQFRLAVEAVAKRGRDGTHQLILEAQVALPRIVGRGAAQFGDASGHVLERLDDLGEIHGDASACTVGQQVQISALRNSAAVCAIVARRSPIPLGKPEDISPLDAYSNACRQASTSAMKEIAEISVWPISLISIAVSCGVKANAGFPVFIAFSRRLGLVGSKHAPRAGGTC
jgi:hypothetical protein